MAQSRDIVIRLIGDNESLSRSLKASVNDIGQASSGFEQAGQRISGVGQTMTRTVTPAAAAAGAVFLKASQDYNQGLIALRAGAGATGQALGDLEASARGIAGQVRADFSEVATVMADLATRTGATGEALEDLTRQTVQLQELGMGGDVATLTRVFGDWGVAIEDSATAVDALYVASQTTGPTVDRLGQLMVQFGAPLREFGFEMNEAAALLGKFEQEGVNTELVMGALRIGLGKFAAAGRDPVEALEEVITSIQNASTAAEANTIAFETFGRRAGVDMSRAIQEGRFDLEELNETLANNADTVEAAYTETLTLIDRFGMMKDSAMATVGPFSDVGFALAGVAAGVGPAVQGIGYLVTNMATMRTRAASAAAFMMGPWGLALGAASLGLGLLWNEQQQANDRIRSATALIDENTGALNENAAQTRSLQLQESGLAAQADEYGISLATLTAASMGSAEAQAEMDRVFRDSVPGYAAVLDGTYQAGTALAETTTRAFDLTNAVNEQSAALDGQQSAARAAVEAGDMVSRSMDGQAESTDGAATAIAAATSLLNPWNNGLVDLTQAAHDSAIATRSWAEATAGAGVDTAAFGQGVTSYMRDPLLALADTLCDLTDPLAVYADLTPPEPVQARTEELCAA